MMGGSGVGKEKGKKKKLWNIEKKNQFVLVLFSRLVEQKNNNLMHFVIGYVAIFNIDWKEKTEIQNLFRIETIDEMIDMYYSLV